MLGVVPEWEPVLLAACPMPGRSTASAAPSERDIALPEVERRAASQGLQAMRWPAEWPPDSTLAMRVATYAKQIGRGVAFSLAAFRQAFAAGRDLAEPDTVLIAAAACEMHPRAVLAAECARPRRRAGRACARAAPPG